MELQTLELHSLSLFETNKAQRAEFVQSIVTKLEEGEQDPLKVHLQVKAMEDIITQLTSTDEKKNKNVHLAQRYKTLLYEAFTNHACGAKTVEHHNARFTQTETGSKWHYEKTEDPVLLELYKQRDELAEQIKNREKFLQAVPKEGMDIITADGEAVKVYPPYKTSTTSISVTLK